MKFPPWLKVYGDQSYRGKCPVEDVEHINFVGWVRFNHPDQGAILIHPKNEGKRTNQQTNKDKKLGLTTGASDIIIPASISFICEIKRLDHVNCSSWQPGQKEYLLAAQKQGSFCCVALGASAAKEAFNDWLDILASSK